MQPGKNPAWALTQHPTFIFTYLFPPISCTHKLLQLITARENHSCHAPLLPPPRPAPAGSIKLPRNSQAASGAGTSTSYTQASTPPLDPSPPSHSAWREATGTCPFEVEGAPSWLQPPPKDLSTCLLHDSSLGATGRRNNENWMQLGFWFFK